MSHFALAKQLLACPLRTAPVVSQPGPAIVRGSRMAVLPGGEPAASAHVPTAQLIRAISWKLEAYAEVALRLLEGKPDTVL